MTAAEQLTGSAWHDLRKLQRPTLDRAERERIQALMDTIAVLQKYGTNYLDSTFTPALLHMLERARQQKGASA